MRRWLIRFIVSALLVACVGAGYVVHRANAYLDEPISRIARNQTLTIPNSSTFRQIVNLLSDAHIVTDPWVFEAYARLEGADQRIKAGRYRVNLAQTPRELLVSLQTGGLIPQVRITIPEGFNRWQIADLLSEADLVDRAAFLERVKRDQLEGRLFPDTYWIRKDATLDDVIRVLTDRFDDVFEELIRGHRRQKPLQQEDEARRDLLILASLVEKEARTDRDRRLVSRVFQNRLARGMKLQTDPTCVYSATHYTKVPSPRLCRDTSSRYSTYIIPGLPPTPIANPGRAALQAALEPATGPRADKLLYFVARKDDSGEHHFSETYREHNRAVSRYLKNRK